MLSQLRSNWSQSIVAVIAVLVSVLAIVLLQLPQLNELKSGTQQGIDEALQREVEQEKLRLSLLPKFPAFGFDNLLADWVFLNFLQYFGDDKVRLQTGYGLSPEYFKIIVERDPRFLGAYIGLSTSISLYAGKPAQSVALIEKGLQSMTPKIPSKSYYLWRLKGIDELLFMGDVPAAKQSFESAAEWASTYPDEESQQIAAFSRQTAAFLARNPSSKLAQINSWAMVLNNVTDERTRQLVINRIESLGGKIIVTPEGTLRIQLPEID